MKGFQAGERQCQTLAAFWRVDSKVVSMGPRTREEPGSEPGLGEEEESTGFRVILEAEWNIHGGGCQGGGGAGSSAGREAPKVMGGGVEGPEVLV